jgi:type III pantothenate kinase
MLLAVDIGNTNIVVGLFKGGKLVNRSRIISGAGSKMSSVRGKIDAAIIASVVPELNADVSRMIKKLYKIKPIIVDYKMLKKLKITVKEKGQIGVDRLVNAIAVKTLYGKPAIIIDFGTATTFCALDLQGRYRGGAITSGLAISRDVLFERTSKLPRVEISKPKRAIGQDTVEAMRSGLFFGYIDMVEGMVKRIKKELGSKPIIVATGGLSSVISKGTKIFDVVDRDLTLKGLNIIYNEYCRKDQEA